MSDTHVIPATLAQGEYDVTVAAGLLDRVGPRLRELCPSPKVVVVTDSNVGPLYLDRARGSLESAGYKVVSFTMTAGEANKSLDTLRDLYDAVLPAKIERSTPVIGLGGGVTTDLAGFAAATLLRGLPYVAVPTSLLAMVDASVGGKTGVNHAAGKNLVGSFHMPRAVLIDPATLESLPDRELRGGLAECVKHDIIRDAEHFARMEEEAGQYLARNLDVLADLVAHNVRIKAAVVRADPFEKGKRAHLNLGHTFGHAFEKVTNFEVSHGEAVAIGTFCAAELSLRMGLMKEAEADRIIDLLERLGLPTGINESTFPGLAAPDPADVLAAMKSDKKVAAGRLRLVVPERIGSAVIRDDVEDELLLTVVKCALV